ncbi:MAG: agmatinase [Candidatus Omnitrophica bacterium]|nr:agmatinase [Candidatus Omnitrophota bacterium]
MKLSFGGVDNDLPSFKKAKAVILPVPYGKTVTYRKGTEKGPSAILKASDNLELFDGEINKEIYKIGINTLSPLKVNGLKPEKMIKVVEDKVFDIFKKKKFPVILGGEHSVTIGAVRAMKKHYKDLSILYFDAHYDLRDKHKGSRYNHACVARRLIEISPVIEAGVRSLSKEEFDFLPDKNVKVIKMLDMMKRPDWEKDVKKYLSKNVYISVDLDVLDPSIMPSVGTPEPGGMGWYGLLRGLRKIIADKKIVGFDVVELSPIKDMISPDFTAAKLVYKMLGYVFC